MLLAAVALAAQVGCGKKGDESAKSEAEPAPKAEPVAAKTEPVAAKTEPVAEHKVLALLFHSDT